MLMNSEAPINQPDRTPEQAPTQLESEQEQEPTQSEYGQEQDSAEAEKLALRKRIQRVGAKVLSASAFHKRVSLVESSFKKALEAREKLPGSNDERRNYAYLERLQTIIDERGPDAEKRLWKRSVANIPLIQTENITESTWESIRRDNRDHGGGDIPLTPELREHTAEAYRSVQQQELEGFAAYFGAEDCPFPLWFKVYAWDGLTRLSRSTTTSKRGQTIFRKRDSHTTSGFPKLNPAALAKVYDRICTHYGIPADMTGEVVPPLQSPEEEDDASESTVWTDSFNELYSHELSQMGKPVEVPENPEDVHGEWIEYGLEDVEQLSSAAQGTPWCIVSSSVAKNYLTHGNYNAGARSGPAPESKAKFYLFHLTDPETGMPSPTACASIRLGVDGKVAEISGTMEDTKQRLNPSLLETVKEKALSLPGGERLYQAFLDNGEIIRLEKKVEAGEPLTMTELRFVYELDRRVEPLNPNRVDDRLGELREIAHLVENGTDINDILKTLIAERPKYVVAHLDEFIKYNAQIDFNQLVNNLSAEDTLDSLDTLISHGINIDFDKLVDDLKNSRGTLSDAALHNAKKYGFLDKIIDILSPEALGSDYYLTRLCGIGANIDQIMAKLKPKDIIKNLDYLIQHKATINYEGLVASAQESDLNTFYKKLIEHGASATQIAERIHPVVLIENLSYFIEKEAQIDLNQLFDNLEDGSIDQIQYIDAFAKHMGMEAFLAKLNPYSVERNIGLLIEKGADIDQIVAVLYTEMVERQLKLLIEKGANIDAVVKRLSPYCIIDNLDYLIEHNATINIDELMDKTDPERFTKEGLNSLVEFILQEPDSGAAIPPEQERAVDTIAYLANVLEDENHNIDMDKISKEKDTDPDGFAHDLDEIARKGSAIVIMRNIDALTKHGVDINRLAAMITKADPDLAIKELDTLISHNADINQIVANLDQNHIDAHRETLNAHGANL